jgi:hypothetical protein
MQYEFWTIPLELLSPRNGNDGTMLSTRPYPVVLVAHSLFRCVLLISTHIFGRISPFSFTKEAIEHFDFEWGR